MEFNYYYRSAFFITQHFVLAVIFSKRRTGAVMFAKMFPGNFLIIYTCREQLCRKLPGQLLTKEFQDVTEIDDQLFGQFSKKG